MPESYEISVKDECSCALQLLCNYTFLKHLLFVTKLHWNRVLNIKHSTIQYSLQLYCFYHWHYSQVVVRYSRVAIL